MKYKTIKQVGKAIAAAGLIGIVAGCQPVYEAVAKIKLPGYRVDINNDGIEDRLLVRKINNEGREGYYLMSELGIDGMNSRENATEACLLQKTDGFEPYRVKWINFTSKKKNLVFELDGKEYFGKNEEDGTFDTPYELVPKKEESINHMRM